MREKYAFIIIPAELDSSKSAIEELKKVEGVVELYRSRGARDNVVRVSVNSWSVLVKMSSNR